MTDALIIAHDWFPRSLPQGVVIGPRSWLYSSFAFLHCHSRRPTPVSIGSDSGIYHGSFFELGASGEVEIGNFCTLVGVIIRTNHRVLIEDYAFIAHEVVIADSFAAAPGTEETPGPETEPASLSVVIRRNAWIGARAILLRGADIGEGAIVGAAAVVDFPVPPFAIVAGNPAITVGSARSK
jgi:acetyltransferase-like isoleucine patch superfamily enzyme